MRPRVLLIMPGADTGGSSYNISAAFTRDAPDWHVRSMVRRDNYIGYPHDLFWDRRALREEWSAADVIHLHHNFSAADLFERRYGTRPYIVHYHGTSFRKRPDEHLAEMRRRGASGLVSTLDLWLISPEELEWLPAPHDINWLRNMRDPFGGDHVRIAHAPTERAIKSTDAFMAACDRLRADGLAIVVDLIERESWTECLKRKARADIYYDQVTLGYGNNAIEAWGMGIPVIAGAAPETLDEMERRFGHLPFYPATEETLYEALRDLVVSRELRDRYAQIGHDHVWQWHDGAKVVQQLQDIYQRSMLSAAA